MMETKMEFLLNIQGRIHNEILDLIFNFINFKVQFNYWHSEFVDANVLLITYLIDYPKKAIIATYTFEDCELFFQATIPYSQFETDGIFIVNIIDMPSLTHFLDIELPDDDNTNNQY